MPQLGRSSLCDQFGLEEVAFDASQEGVRRTVTRSRFSSFVVRIPYSASSMTASAKLMSGLIPSASRLCKVDCGHRHVTAVGKAVSGGCADVAAYKTRADG